jgi:hypothetical protein
MLQIRWPKTYFPKTKRSISCLALFVCASHAALAQSSASIVGSVRDSSDSTSYNLVSYRLSV